MNAQQTATVISEMSHLDSRASALWNALKNYLLIRRQNEVTELSFLHMTVI